LTACHCHPPLCKSPVLSINPSTDLPIVLDADVYVCCRDNVVTRPVHQSRPLLPSRSCPSTSPSHPIHNPIRPRPSSIQDPRKSHRWYPPSPTPSNPLPNGFPPYRLKCLFAVVLICGRPLAKGNSLHSLPRRRHLHLQRLQVIQ
jgi:hypothetical protein